jgi:hypothetical protein
MSRQTMTPPTEIDTTPQASRHLRGDLEDPLMFLEQEQFVSDRSVPVLPAHLSSRAKAALWLLRVFALTVSAMVIYTFVAQLH